MEGFVYTSGTKIVYSDLLKDNEYIQKKKFNMITVGYGMYFRLMWEYFGSERAIAWASVLAQEKIDAVIEHKCKQFEELCVVNDRRVDFNMIRIIHGIKTKPLISSRSLK